MTFCVKTLPVAKNMPHRSPVETNQAPTTILGKQLNANGCELPQVFPIVLAMRLLQARQTKSEQLQASKLPQQLHQHLSRKE
jgi:hypothetical protein